MNSQINSSNSSKGKTSSGSSSEPITTEEMIYSELKGEIRWLKLYLKMLKAKMNIKEGNLQTLEYIKRLEEAILKNRKLEVIKDEGNLNTKKQKLETDLLELSKNNAKIIDIKKKNIEILKVIRNKERELVIKNSQLRKMEEKAKSGNEEDTVSQVVKGEEKSDEGSINILSKENKAY
ncbi:hypothetical protein K502DRAFT_333243 [Neoconidiobolus thromboides FSU 785]|nr:hypothetical protein K502DRAFT_333243 [Neoconidiobolus thromboides FSU 785]